MRLPAIHYHPIAPVMDAVATGVMATNVRTAEQAREVVWDMRYAPETLTNEILRDTPRIRPFPRHRPNKYDRV